MTKDHKIETNEPQEDTIKKDLDVYTCSVKFWVPGGAQVSVAATDEYNASVQVLEILSEHRDAEIVSIYNASRINMPLIDEGDRLGTFDDEDSQSNDTIN